MSLRPPTVTALCDRGSLRRTRAGGAKVTLSQAAGAAGRGAHVCRTNDAPSLCLWRLPLSVTVAAACRGWSACRGQADLEYPALFLGANYQNRTDDLRVTNALLYRLS